MISKVVELVHQLTIVRIIQFKSDKTRLAQLYVLYLKFLIRFQSNTKESSVSTNTYIQQKRKHQNFFFDFIISL